MRESRGMKVPIGTTMGLQLSDELNVQTINIDTISKLLVSGIQCIIGTEKSFDAGISLK